MKNLKLYIVLLSYLVILGDVFAKSISSADDQTFIRNIKMNNTVSTRSDDLRCTYIKMDSERRQYIFGYTPHSDKRIAHHMVLFGCKKPAIVLNDAENENWFCGIGSEGICEKDKEVVSENIIYAWALNAGELNFPEGTGMRVGGDTEIQYLVLQMHYKDKFKEGIVDNSGLSIKMTYEEMYYQVGLFVLGNFGYIPPKTKEFHMESGCDYKYPFDIVPFAYRTHAHNLGRVISAYVIKNDDHKTYELGRMSPQQPQLFYNVTNSDTVITQYDKLVSKCIMDSTTRIENTYIGPRNDDEMCNFYMLYYTNFNGNLADTFCFNDAQTFSWKGNMSIINDIENSDNLKGVVLLEPDNEMQSMNHDI